MSEAETQAAAILDKMYARGMNAKEFAAELAAAEERGFRRGIERAATALRNIGYDHAARVAEAQLPFAPPVPEDLRK